LREDDNDSVDSAKIREQIDLMVEEFPEENEKSSSWTIFNDTFLMFSGMLFKYLEPTVLIPCHMKL
jgi:hypothetical protein